METRQFKHKCRHCRFLGRYEFRERKYDLYFCANQLVSRYGDDADDYDGFHVSMMEIWDWRMDQNFPGIAEAHRRMKRKQLFL
jgi:hypothetical protein